MAQIQVIPHALSKHLLCARPWGRGRDGPAGGSATKADPQTTKDTVLEGQLGARGEVCARADGRSSAACICARHVLSWILYISELIIEPI